MYAQPDRTESEGGAETRSDCGGSEGSGDHHHGHHRLDAAVPSIERIEVDGEGEGDRGGGRDRSHRRQVDGQRPVLYPARQGARGSERAVDQAVDGVGAPCGRCRPSAR